MYNTAYYIKDVAQIPGCWAELTLDRATGIWEYDGNSYFVTDNGLIIDASTGAKYEVDDFDEAGDRVWRLQFEKRSGQI